MAEHYTKPDPKLIHSPVDELCGDPHNLKQAEGVYDGEPGYPGRTGGDDSLPQLTLDKGGPLGKVKHEG